MILSKSEFERIIPLRHIVVEVGCLYKDTYGDFKLMDDITTRQLNATHKGTVVKEPMYKLIEAGSDGGNIRHGAEYEIELGDTVYFGWNALYKIDKLDEADVWIVPQFEGDESPKLYLLMDYRDFLMCERGEERFGLNGYCVGYHPKKQGIHSDLIYIPSENWEQEVIEAVNGTIYEHDKSDVVKDQIKVLYAPKSKVTWKLSEVIHSTDVKVGDTVCFPEGMAIPISNEIKQEHSLMAINTSQIFAYQND